MLGAQYTPVGTRIFWF